MDYTDWKWLNESRAEASDDGIVIRAPARTDWFRNPIPKGKCLEPPVADAPILYREVTGDFVFRARVRPNFVSVYDACALMVVQDELHWCKAAFEKTDFGTAAAVCVVTNIVSDDANGCDIAQDHLWLQIARVGDVFAVHCSTDGAEYHMVRLFCLPLAETVKVGLEAQSPAGEGGPRCFDEVSLEQRTIAELRAGV